jgi:hypothetical protein
MTEIVFVVEDDPDGGYTVRAVGESIYHSGRRQAGPARKGPRRGTLPFPGRRPSSQDDPAALVGDELIVA